MSTNSDTPNEVRPGGIGPGDRLQAARIEQGLSVEDIANKMHLSVSILESIEENNFDDITAPIFVKGYLRAYARIVALGEEDMIQQYVEFYSDEDPPISSTSTTSPEISSADARVKWTTYIVILILCGLLAAWWWSNNQKRDESVSLEVEETTIEVEEIAVLDTVSGDGVIVATSDPALDSSATDPEVSKKESEATIKIIEKQSETLEAAQVVTATDGDGVNDESVIEIDAQDTQIVESTNLETSSGVGESAAVEIAQFSELAEISAGDFDVIKLTVHADTWADIKDADGKRLMYDLIRADRQLTLAGRAPFTAFFGNGHGVEVMFNSAEVDVAKFIRSDNTARLEIGTN